MTLKEYALEHCDLKNRVSTLFQNPYAAVINSDDFEYDKIELVDDVPMKVIYYPDGARTIPVIELLSYRREDLVKSGDKELLDLYDNYTKDFTIVQWSLADSLEGLKK